MVRRRPGEPDEIASEEQPVDEMPDLLTVEQVARRLSMGRSFVYETLIRTGRLRVVRLGKSVRVPRRQVDEFLAELESEPAAAAV